MSQAYYRKWRPQKWDQVVAQDHVVQTLRNAVRNERTGHAYLLAGPRGTGKTTTARLLAKALNCLDDSPANRPCDECVICKAINEGRFLDLIEIDAASNTSVDDVRDLRDKINFSPSQGKFKVYIIDEVHMLSTAAFNALLKTLEEPPPHAVFVLATTEVHKIPATILSRVQRYEFRRIPVNDIVKHLKMMAKEENIEVDDDALVAIARQATGAMRDAISLLDQLASTGQRVTLQETQVVLGTAASRSVIDLVKTLLAKDAAAGMACVQSALDAGNDPRQFARQVVEYLRSLMLVKMGNAEIVDATKEMRHEMAVLAGQFDPVDRLVEAIRVFNAAAVDTRSAWHPGLALELAVAEVTAARPPAVQAAEQAPTLIQPAKAPTQTSPPARRPPPEPSPPPESDDLIYFEPAAEGQEPAPKTAAPARGTAQTSKGEAEHRPEPRQPAQAENEPGEKTVTYVDIQHNWNRIRDMVKKRNKVTEAALNSCRYSLKDGKLLVLSFQTDVVKSKMETEENVKLLRDALHAILGVRLNVRCVLASHKAGDPTADLDVDGDGIVGTALDLGGKIVYEE